MQMEIGDDTYERLQQLSQQRGDTSLTQTLDAIILHSHASGKEVQHIRSLVEEGIRSASEDPLVDGEAFFEELRTRRSKAA